MICYVNPRFNAGLIRIQQTHNIIGEIMNKTYGPQLAISQEIGQEKHYPLENHEQASWRWATALCDGEDHKERLFDMFHSQRVLLAGRVQRAAGHFDKVTAFNCFVSGDIHDSMRDIMQKNLEAALTMQKGGGIGYNFGTLRPKGAKVIKTGSHSSGPMSFMEVFNSTCSTVASAGDRRGAQMAVMPIWHPDIKEFIHAKANNDVLRFFNTSVGITDQFMNAVINDEQFSLVWEDEIWEVVNARDLWDDIMQMTWDWAEPGVLFIDRINKMNNLWYAETISATNPCGEQPLPPYGACLLASINWVKYLIPDDTVYRFEMHKLLQDIPDLVRALDNVIDRTIYPLPEQEREAKQKRRMGIGCTGVANTLEALGFPYGSPKSAEWLDKILHAQVNVIYLSSVHLAMEKGSFPLFDKEKYLQGNFIKSLEPHIQQYIREYGIRNSHLTSIAPTGTISLAADNVSSGLEPPFQYSFVRKIVDGRNFREELVTDYAYRELGIRGRTADDLSPEEHVRMLSVAQRLTDSAVSKTCNIGPNVTFDEFKEVYMQAYRSGAKGCTTFRSAGKRFGILTTSMEDEPESCTFDPATGQKTCE